MLREIREIMQRMIARWRSVPPLSVRLWAPQFWALVSGLLALTIVACTGAGPDVQAIATATPPPTAAPTGVPTPTPTPTPTLAPTPAAQPNVINLPDDEGAHLTPIEWWYFNGHLSDDSGSEYSFHYVIFQSVLPSGLTPRLAHLSWADHGKGVYSTAEQAGLPQAIASTGAFDLTMSTWYMSGDGANYSLMFDVGEYSLELQASAGKSPALHQGNGLVDLGKAGKTYYYSRTRLNTSGTLTIEGAVRQVAGIAWMDHQWGDFSTAPVGWDWLGLQLDDGSELMVSLVWDSSTHNPIINYGTYIPASSEELNLSGDDISLTATGSWTSPVTGAGYPMGWQLEVKPLALSLTLTPQQLDSEFEGSKFVPPAYWEGAVIGNGTKDGRAITGKGFMELVGYDTRELEYPNLRPGK